MGLTHCAIITILVATITGVVAERGLLVPTPGVAANFTISGEDTANVTTPGVAAENRCSKLPPVEWKRFADPAIQNITDVISQGEDILVFHEQADSAVMSRIGPDLALIEQITLPRDVRHVHGTYVEGGVVWVATMHGKVVKLLMNNDKSISQKYYEVETDCMIADVTGPATESNGTIYVATNVCYPKRDSYLFKISPDNEAVTRVELADATPLHCVKTSGEYLVLCEEEGAKLIFVKPGDISYRVIRRIISWLMLSDVAIAGDRLFTLGNDLGRYAIRVYSSHPKSSPNHFAELYMPASGSARFRLPHSISYQRSGRSLFVGDMQGGLWYTDVSSYLTCRFEKQHELLLRSKSHPLIATLLLILPEVVNMLASGF